MDTNTLLAMAVRHRHITPTMKRKVNQSWKIIQEAYDIKPSDLAKLQVIAILFGIKESSNEQAKS